MEIRRLTTNFPTPATDRPALLANEQVANGGIDAADLGISVTSVETPDSGLHFVTLDQEKTG